MNSLNPTARPLVDLCAVVFDMDGLIVNSEDVYEQADREVLRRRGKMFEAELREQMTGRPTADSLRLMIEHHALDDALDALERERTALRDQLMDNVLQPMSGLVPLLESLAAATIPAAVATSGTRDYASEVLSRLDIGDYFQFVLTAEDVQQGKPAPEIYELAVARLCLTPPEVMVLEDSANGCRAGVSAGAFTVAVPNRHTVEHDFDGVRFVADTLADPRIRSALRLPE